MWPEQMSYNTEYSIATYYIRILLASALNEWIDTDVTLVKIEYIMLLGK